MQSQHGLSAVLLWILLSSDLPVSYRRLSTQYKELKLHFFPISPKYKRNGRPMSLSRNLAVITALLVGSVLVLCGWLVLSDEQRLLEEAKLREIGKTGVVLSSALQQAATFSASHAEAIAADDKVRSLMKAGDRAALQAYMKPVFDRLAATGDVDVLHFHDVAMKSFLRVWEPENFGQDLSTFRPMVVAANHDRRLQKGLELGIRGLSLRAVAPILDGDVLVGTLEVGVSIKSLTELSKSLSGADFALFLDPAVSKANAPASRPSALAIDATTDNGLFTALDATGPIHLTRAAYTDTAEINGRALGTLTSPLIDYSGNVIGVTVVMSDMTPLERHLNQSIVTVGAISLGGLLIVLAFVVVSVRAAVVRPLLALAEAIRTGDASDVPTGGIAEYRAVREALADWLRRKAAAARLEKRP